MHGVCGVYYDVSVYGIYGMWCGILRWGEVWAFSFHRATFIIFLFQTLFTMWPQLSTVAIWLSIVFFIV